MLQQLVEAAIERTRSATGVEDPLQFAAKFEKHTAVAAEWQEKAEAAKARIARLQEELKATKQAEQTAFLEYDQHRLTSRKKALRPRTSADRASRAHRAAATSAWATSAFSASMRPFVFSNSLLFVARRRSMRSSNAVLFAALRSA